MPDTTARRVLIVEDEALIAMLLEQMVLDLGYEVVGPASTVDEALSLLERDPCDGAVLDVTLGNGVLSTPVAEALRAKGVPFLFASGHGAAGVDNAGDAPVLTKPFFFGDLEKALHGLFDAPTGPIAAEQKTKASG